jgi:hypothetical protein
MNTKLSAIAPSWQNILPKTKSQKCNEHLWPKFDENKETFLRNHYLITKPCPEESQEMLSYAF